jgi:para-nitrobenzyl esterase
VPLLIGTDLDEMQVMQVVAPEQYAFDDATLSQRFAAVFGEHADRAASLYADQVKGTGWNPWWQVEGDRLFLLPATELAEAQLAAGGDAWMYLFAWRSPGDGGRLGAMHTMEIPFVFNTLDLGSSPFITGGPPADVRPLAHLMHTAWAAFARRGVCSWPSYDTGRRATMVFDVHSKAIEDPSRDRRLLWADVAAGS